MKIQIDLSDLQALRGAICSYAKFSDRPFTAELQFAIKNTAKVESGEEA